MCRDPCSCALTRDALRAVRGAGRALGIIAGEWSVERAAPGSQDTWLALDQSRHFAGFFVCKVRSL